MRILVTGREGQVAKSLAERNPGHELIFTTRPGFDLTEPGSIERTVDAVAPDLVISAAAYTAVDKAEDEFDLAMKVNGEAPGVLARSVRRIGAPIIHLSTDYVFDGTLDRPYQESDAAAPISVYGLTKLAGEEEIIASGASYAILRTSWVYSHYGNNFLKTMLRLATDRDSISVVNDQFGCPTSALDIADGIFALIETWRSNPAHGTDQRFHLNGTGETSWAGFAQEIFEQLRRHQGAAPSVTPISSTSYPNKAARPANSRLNGDKFAATFGYRMPNWRDAVALVAHRLFAA